MNKYLIAGIVVLVAVAVVAVAFFSEIGSNQTFDPCDVNQDGIINSADAEEVFAHRSGEAPYEEKYDLNGDGIVNIQDSMIVSNHEDFVE